MFHLLYFTHITAFLSLFLLLAIALILKSSRKNSDSEPPSPRSLPIIGHLHLLSGYEVPYQAFTALAKKYGDVVKLKLGNVKCVAVNGQKGIREALVTRGHHFDSRPNFQRYQQLFCGNKENSLAFCDWSETQKTRREMLRAYTFPRAFTHKFNSLETIISTQTNSLLSNLETSTEIKPKILSHCANIFLNHFCSKDFEGEDAGFADMVRDFDDIFWEVNQGYAADFLPFLLPLHQKNLARMNSLTHRIRRFVLERVVEGRYERFSEEDPDDYVESLIKHVKTDETSDLSWDTALFALEDIIGGHSAVGNFLVKLLGFLVNEPEVQRKVQEEIEAVVGEREVVISDRSQMPYTEGVIFEAVRLIASPIVPRVANQDSSINGYTIAKGTVIFLNNHDLSMSEELWDEPQKFKPERFVKEGKFVKPEHFLPFGGGRRSCMGYKMVQLVSFGILSRLLQSYTITPVDGQAYKVPIGSLALPRKTFEFKFVRR